VPESKRVGPLFAEMQAQKIQLDAQLRVEEVNEQLGLHLPESEDYGTIAGYILYALRHIPKEGEQLKADDVKITVTGMNGPKIEKGLITRL